MDVVSAALVQPLHTDSCVSWPIESYCNSQTPLVTELGKNRYKKKIQLLRATRFHSIRKENSYLKVPALSKIIRAVEIFFLIFTLRDIFYTHKSETLWELLPGCTCKSTQNNQKTHVRVNRMLAVTCFLTLRLAKVLERNRHWMQSMVGTLKKINMVRQCNSFLY